MELDSDLVEALRKLLALLQDRGRYVIGALHVFGHQLLCQLKLSVRRVMGMGLTTGEECEQFNSRIVACSASLRKMRYVNTCKCLFLIYFRISFPAFCDHLDLLSAYINMENELNLRIYTSFYTDRWFLP